MEWQEQALVLSARSQGETSTVLSVLTEGQGRWWGLVRGGRRSPQRGGLEPGTLVDAFWRARLADHLGALTVECGRSYAAPLLDEPGPLAALLSSCAVVDAAVPERQPCPGLFPALTALWEALAGPAWAEAYIAWELVLLAAVGHALDLSCCAATGTTEDLVWVSPRSGRAVSAQAGEPYRQRLLPLPPFLTGRGTEGPEAIRDGLHLTGFFLERYLSQGLPPARVRLMEAWGKE